MADATNELIYETLKALQAGVVEQQFNSPWMRLAAQVD
jgi:hypothetical protein